MVRVIVMIIVLRFYCVVWHCDYGVDALILYEVKIGDGILEHFNVGNESGLG